MTDCQEEIRGLKKELKRKCKEVESLEYQGYTVGELKCENENLKRELAKLKKEKARPDRVPIPDATKNDRFVYVNGRNGERFSIILPAGTRIPSLEDAPDFEAPEGPEHVDWLRSIIFALDLEAASFRNERDELRQKINQTAVNWRECFYKEKAMREKAEDELTEMATDIVKAVGARIPPTKENS
jgi:hypothetical protein